MQILVETTAFLQLNDTLVGIAAGFTSESAAWRMGHALRLMAAGENMLDGTVEIDHFHPGGKSPKTAGSPTSGTGPSKVTECRP